MNNHNAAQLLTGCKSELNKIKALIDDYGQFHNAVPYLTYYSVILVCGAIEQSYKTIIADRCEDGHNQHAKTYIQGTFREGSRNPSYDNMCKSLEKFNPNWNVSFKKKLSGKGSPKLKSSLKSLNEARNALAHGGKTDVSFASVVSFFDDSIIIIELLDSIVL